MKSSGSWLEEINLKKEREQRELGISEGLRRKRFDLARSDAIEALLLQTVA